MAEPEYYRQCRLRKWESDTAYLETVSFIPSPFCVEGKILKLKDSDGSWDDGWKVIWAGARTSPEMVERLSNTHKIHRQASDI